MDRNEILRMVGSEPGRSIVASELDRIEKFSTNDMIPLEASTIEQLKRLGFKILDNKTSDVSAKFIQTEFPIGWIKKLNKERDWRVDIIDDKGRLRGYFKYKPSDYAYTKLHTRFEILVDPDFEFDNDITYAIIVFDNLTRHFPYVTGEINQGTFEKSRDLAQQMAEAWLNTNYPMWQSYLAYWD
jgi:hypothetical protein